MKGKNRCFAAAVVLLLLVTTLLVAGEPATEEIGRAMLLMCIKDDGYAVSIAVRTDGDGTLTASVIDGSAENQLLTSVTSIRQEAEGVVIDWGEEKNPPSTLTILGAHIVEVRSN